MKKILLVLLILLPTIVKAESIPPEKKMETRYRFYYLEKEYATEFYKEGDSNKEYPKKSELFHYGDKIQKSLDKPQFEEDIIEEKTITRYQKSKPIRYIVLESITSDYAMNLQELEVWNNDQKIEYRVDCSNCSSEFFAKVQNTLVNSEINYINNDVNITLDLKKEYYPEDLTLKIHMESTYGKKLNFRLRVNSTNDYRDRYYNQDFTENLTYYKEIAIPLKNVNHEERYEEEIRETDSTNITGKILDQKTYYFYKDRYYLYYKENKKYLDGYYTDIKGLHKDLTDSKQFEIKPNIKIVEVPIEIEKTIEKEVPVEVEKIVKEEVPVIETKTVEVEKRIEVPKEIIKEVTIPSKKNYLYSYTGYLIIGLILKKMSYF